jgi:hypothetical protein
LVCCLSAADVADKLVDADGVLALLAMLEMLTVKDRSYKSSSNKISFSVD